MADVTTEPALSPCPHCDFAAKSDFGLRAHVRVKHPEPETAPEGEPASDIPPVTDAAPSGPEPEAPQRKKRSWREKLIGPKKQKVDVAPTGGEKAPKSSRWGPVKPRGRVNVGPLAGMVYGLLGGKLASSQGQYAPVGNVLMIQAPIAEAKFDALVKGTVADRVIQPFAKAVDSSEDAAALIGLPICTAAWVNAPHLRPALTPVMRMLVQATLVDLVPAMRKARQEAEKQAAALSELSEEFDVPAGVDPIDYILGGILNVDTTPEEASNNGSPPGQPEDAVA